MELSSSSPDLALFPRPVLQLSGGLFVSVHQKRASELLLMMSPIATMVYKQVTAMPR